MKEGKDHRWPDNAAGVLASRQGSLRELSREHADALVLADQIAHIAAHGDERALAEGIALIKRYNETEFEAHLQHEEQTIFAPLIQHHREHLPICVTLGKEHGLLRTLVEAVSEETARTDLADFARVLRQHTLVEEERLFPLVEALFDDARLEAIARFRPLGRKSPPPPSHSAAGEGGHGDQVWLTEIDAHLAREAATAGSIVLFPRYRPDLSRLIATHTGLGFFDFQKAVMEDLGTAAEQISLDQLSEALRGRAESGAVVVHNVEALLAVKTEDERRHWFQTFLDTDWPNPVLITVTAFQADVPEAHPGVCDLELRRFPRQPLDGAVGPPERIKYDVGGIA